MLCCWPPLWSLPWKPQKDADPSTATLTPCMRNLCRTQLLTGRLTQAQLLREKLKFPTARKRAKLVAARLNAVTAQPPEDTTAAWSAALPPEERSVSFKYTLNFVLLQLADMTDDFVVAGELANNCVPAGEWLCSFSRVFSFNVM